MKRHGFLIGAGERRLLGKEDSSRSTDPGLCPDSAACGMSELLNSWGLRASPIK